MNTDFENKPINPSTNHYVKTNLFGIFIIIGTLMSIGCNSVTYYATFERTYVSLSWFVYAIPIFLLVIYIMAVYPRKPRSLLLPISFVGTALVQALTLRMMITSAAVSGWHWLCLVYSAIDAAVFALWVVSTVHAFSWFTKPGSKTIFLVLTILQIISALVPFVGNLRSCFGYPGLYDLQSILILAGNILGVMATILISCGRYLFIHAYDAGITQKEAPAQAE